MSGRERTPPDAYAESAHILVNQVIDAALKKLIEEEGLLKEGTLEQLTAEEIRREDTYFSELPKEDYSIKNIEWITIGDFSVELAEKKLNEFIQTWEYEDAWLYCIDYLGEEDFEFDKRFRFRVRWSIPTRRKPIPRATAHVYFTFEVSKIKPKSYPVKIYYVFETNRMVHRPGESRFREKWLKDIIENKVIMMQGIDF